MTPAQIEYIVDLIDKAGNEFDFAWASMDSLYMMKGFETLDKVRSLLTNDNSSYYSSGWYHTTEEE